MTILVVDASFEYLCLPVICVMCLFYTSWMDNECLQSVVLNWFQNENVACINCHVECSSSLTFYAWVELVNRMRDSTSSPNVHSKSCLRLHSYCPIVSPLLILIMSVNRCCILLMVFDLCFTIGNMYDNPMSCILVQMRPSQSLQKDALLYSCFDSHLLPPNSQPSESTSDSPWQSLKPMCWMKWLQFKVDSLDVLCFVLNTSME